MALTVRDARADDKDAVVALWRACGLVPDGQDPAADFQFARAGPSGGRLLANGAAKPLLRGGWNASESVAGFRWNQRLVCIGITGWDPSEYAVVAPALRALDFPGVL